MNYLKRYLFLFVIGLSGLFVFSCANVVSPTGGPKDETPPTVLRSNPANFSTNYDGSDVRIYFDEFVALENLRQNLLVSPPLKNDPEVRIRGKSIIMSVSDTLLAETTYNFFFGESVVDITEKNAIPNFQFVVSTGDYVDSLSVVGILRNAYTLLPEEGVFVMMYENVYDSVPYLERPVYLTKTNKTGNFQINNMRDGKFLMFALKDLNSSFTFDDPTENIGFIDSLVTPYYIAPVIQTISGDSIQRPDSITNPGSGNGVSQVREPDSSVSQNFPDDSSNQQLLTDSLGVDSLNRILKSTYPLFEMFLFQEKDTLQRVVSAYRESKGKVNIAFRVPADSVTVRDYENLLPVNWFLPEYNTTRDTLTLWIPETTVDTLKLEISDRGNIVDSATVSLVARTTRSRFASDDEEPTQTFLNVSLQGLQSRNILPYFEPLRLKSQTPLADFDVSKFQLYLNDTVPVAVDFSFTDEVKRELKMESLLEPDSSYLFFVPPGSITDIFGDTNDTINFKFRINNIDDYGTLMLVLSLPQNDPDIDKDSDANAETDIISDAESIIDTDTETNVDSDHNPEFEPDTDSEPEPEPEPETEPEAEADTDSDENQYLLQLLDVTLETVIQEKVISKSDTYTFNYLPASKFMIRLIVDENKNGVWDTGKYLDAKQPEKVYIFKEVVETRLNWEIESHWDLSQD